MLRQNSIGASSDGGSEAPSSIGSRVSRNEKEKEEDPHAADALSRPVLTALFGVLYTLAKENHSSSSVMALTSIFVDTLLVLVLFMTPEFPWAIKPTQWIWKFLWYFEFHNPIAQKSYSFYLSVFYLLTALLLFSVVICIWVAYCFKNDNFPYLWPVKVLRFVVGIFFNMTYIASLNIFLIMGECQTDKSTHHFRHHIYHDKGCFEYPHVIHLGVSGIASVVFSAVAFITVLAENDLNPMSHSLVASPHSMCELRALAAKTLVTAAAILLFAYPKLQAILFTFGTAYTLYYQYKLQPHYIDWMNCLRTACYGIWFYSCLLLCALVFNSKGQTYYLHHGGRHVTHELQHYEDLFHETYHIKGHAEYYGIGHEYKVVVWSTWAFQQRVTNGFVYGGAPIFLLGWGVAYLRLWYLRKIALRFKELKSSQNPKDIHCFTDEYEVEIVSRVARQWDAEGNFDLQAVELGELILQVGIKMLPESPFLHIVYANFLIDVKNNPKSGWAHLEKAQKLGPNLSFSFSIFARLQEAKQRAQVASSGEAQADLVAYVEFQRSHRLIMAYHKAALLATRDFWKLLLRPEVNLVHLTRSFKRIDEMELKADQTYKLVLDRYNKSVKLLRSYAEFLEQVKNDPWAASKYYSEAEKQEELQEAAAATVSAQGDGTAAAILSQLDEKVDAVITISAHGKIQTANRVACRIFGYRKGEMDGQDVSILMPAPFSTRHNSYLKNYARTGKAKILDTVREVVGLHKDRYVFPAKLIVTKVSGANMEPMYLGVVRPIHPDPCVFRGWLLPNGTILCVDPAFHDVAGWAPAELIGKSFSSLGTSPEELEKLLVDAATVSDDDLAAGGVAASTYIQHKYGAPIHMELMITAGGTVDQRVLVFNMKRITKNDLRMALDGRGKVVYSNSAMATMLGYTASQIKTQDITTLLPRPFGQLHLKWLRDAADARSQRVDLGSCRSSSTVMMLSASSNLVPVKLEIEKKQQDTSILWLVDAVRTTADSALDDRRLLLRLSEDGYIVDVSASPTSLFGFEPSQVLGKTIASCVDIFHLLEEERGDVEHGLTALAMLSAMKPGFTMRVGVMPPQAEQASPGAGTAEQKLAARAYVHSHSKAAVMQVEPEEEEDAEGSVGITVRLWRTDMITGVLDISSDCTITKADASAGLLFGIPHMLMSNKPLSNFITDSDGVRAEDLLGLNPQRTGGMKASNLNQVVGPKKLFDAQHFDCQMLQVSLQASHRDRQANGKLVAAVRVMHGVKGNLSYFQQLLEAAQEEEEDERSSVAHDAFSMRRASGVVGLGNSIASIMQDPFDAFAGHLALMRSNSARFTTDETRSKFVSQSFRPPEPPELQPSPLRPVQPSHQPPALAAAQHAVLPEAAQAGRGPRGEFLPSLGGARPSTPQGHGDGGLQTHGSLFSSDGMRARAASELTAAELQGKSTHGSLRDRIILANGVAKRRSLDMGAQRRSLDIGSQPRTMGDASSARPRRRTLEEMSILGTGSTSGSQNWLSPHAAANPSKTATVEAWLIATQDPPIEDVLSTAPQQQQRAALASQRSAEPLEVVPLAALARMNMAVDEEGAAQLGHHPLRSLRGSLDMAGGATNGAREPAQAAEALAQEQGGYQEPESDGNFRRGRRLKRLHHLLNGKSGTKNILKFRLHTWVLLGVMLAFHLGCFIAIIILINSEGNIVDELTAQGEAMDLVHRLTRYGRSFEAAQRGYGFSAANISSISSQLVPQVERLEWLHQGIYLGFKAMRKMNNPPLNHLWTDLNLPALVYQDTQPPKKVVELTSLFNLGNNFVSAMRDLNFMSTTSFAPDNSSIYADNTTDSVILANATILNSRQWHFVHDNGPGMLNTAYEHSLLLLESRAREQLSMLKTAFLVLGLLECVGLSFGAIIYLFHLLFRVSDQRAALFTVFLAIPGGFLRALASKAVDIDDDSSEVHEHEEDKEAADVRLYAATAPAAAAPETALPVANKPKLKGFPGLNPVVVKFESDADGADYQYNMSLFDRLKALLCGKLSSSSHAINGKRLTRITNDVYKLTYPFLLWSICVATVYIVSLIQLQAVQQSVLNVELSGFTLKQTSRVSYFVYDTVLAATAAEKNQSQRLLVAELLNLQRDYRTHVYGTVNNLTLGFLNSGALFERWSNADRLFRSNGCTRLDKSTCLQPNSTYYEVTHSAIDAMIRRLLREGALLARDDVRDLHPGSSRYHFVQQVATIDLQDALMDNMYQLSLQTLKLLQSTRIGHIVLFVLAWLMMLSFIVAIFRPYTKLALMESSRVAELLSQLPPDLDVEGMVEQCWAAAMGTAHNNQRQAARTQNSQVDSFLVPAGSAPARRTAALARKASFFTAIQTKLSRMPQAGGSDGGSGDVEITPGNLGAQDVALRYSGEALRRRGGR